MTVFACLRCSAPLTGDLDEVRFADVPAPVTSDMRPGEDSPVWLGRGTFAVDPEPFGPPYVPSDTGERLLVSAGPRATVLIHPGELRERHLHRDQRRLGGCCGLDGCDGPNLVCSCGAEIATESSDCWMAHVVRLEPQAVVRIS